jgi:hypothetical protein
LLLASNFSLAAFTRGWSALDPLALTVEFAGTTVSALEAAGGAAGAGGSLLSQPADAASAASIRIMLPRFASKPCTFISQISL